MDRKEAEAALAIGWDKWVRNHDRLTREYSQCFEASDIREDRRFMEEFARLAARLRAEQEAFLRSVFTDPRPRDDL